MYQFVFRYARRAGLVIVYPTGAIVSYGGIGCHVDNLRGPILLAIFKARLQYALYTRQIRS